MGTDPFRALAAMLEMRMVGHAEKAVSGLPCELGKITASGLKLDSFKHEIKDYLVADWLVKVHFPDFYLLGEETCMVNADGLIKKDASVDADGNLLSGATTRGLTKYSFKKRVVDNVRLELKSKLQTGDRVLVVSVNNGREAIVVAKVVS